ncbi:extracellular solute-binding protein [Paenibacillus sp. J5C_2022]|uniref:ABC transporter substrate-binding protein n=1 Tax=Paenibacillus sp. J5C2022 TaxID=2977129 RepID=UPI0021CF6F3D|nr:extracellular solute-binding protein [Paenibacillus sp. J5C2022]MCU6710255.1 extracellular solute-binding protein [Paenibacillus sp. J5C2022]
MGKKRKGQSFLVVLFAMIVLLTACTGGGGDPEGEPKTEPSAATEPDAGQEKSEEGNQAPEEEQTIDMQGKPVRVLAWGYAGGEAGTEAGEQRIALEQELENKYNTKFQFDQVPWGDVQDKITASIIAGEPIADIFLLERFRAFPSMVQKDFLQPIDGILDIDSEKWPADLRMTGSFNGEVYGFSTAVGGGGGIYYNKAILQKEGLPDPQELHEKGEWNWDAFLDIAKKATKDTNGDGKIDQYGLALTSLNFVPAFIASNDGDVTKVVDGKLAFAGDDENAMEALRFYSDLSNVHKVVKPNQTDNWEDYINAFNEGIVAMRYGEGWEGGGIQTNLGNEYGFIFIPKGPKATAYHNAMQPTLWFVPKGANPDAVRIYAEYLFGYMPKEGELDAWTETLFADQKSLDNYIEMGNIMTPKDWEGIPHFGEEIRKAWDNIGAGKATPETAMKSIRPVLEGLLDAAQ